MGKKKERNEIKKQKNKRKKPQILYHSFPVKKEQYEIINFNGNNNFNGNTKSVVIKLSSTVGKNYTSTDKDVSVLIHNIKAKRIFVNGQEQIYKRFAEPLQVNVTMTKGTTQEVKIEY